VLSSAEKMLGRRICEEGIGTRIAKNTSGTGEDAEKREEKNGESNSEPSLGYHVEKMTIY
jgi:hypothetical protein